MRWHMQFHANNEKLLDYRVGNLLDATVKQHINECAECLLKIRQYEDLANSLNISLIEELPEVDLDASWKLISTSIDASQKPRLKKPHWIAFAASLVFALLAMMQVFNSEVSVEKNVALTPVISDEPIRVATAQKAPNIDQLVAYSSLIETRLQAMPQPRVVRANTAGTITNLQDQISVLDTRLSMQHQSPLTEQQRNALWQQRVNSINNLYRVRAAQLQRVSY